LTQIKSALVSVYHKDNLAPIIAKLHELGVTLYSTGGTETYIQGLNIPVNAVEDLTEYPSILGGRVKTLHPKIFGGILSRRDLDSDVAQLDTYEIPSIDLVIVDLYPFEEAVASGASHEEIIEKIDIGGISLIRAAAKNYKDVVIVPSMNHYPALLEALETDGGTTTLAFRQKLAADAFAISAGYDTAIHAYFTRENAPNVLHIRMEGAMPLRYGENPHQKGIFYGDMAEVFDQLHGKELSYNNLLDVDAAVVMMGEFWNDEPTFAILKHNNACGLATRSTLAEAYTAALAADPQSAFGGVLIANKPIDLATAEKINDLFCEVVIATSYADDALRLLQSKKNRIILVQKLQTFGDFTVRSALNGVLWQNRDSITDQRSDFERVTLLKPTIQQEDDMLFASKICKHTKSNTIILAKGGQLLAGGTGQTSRVDALKQAIVKAREFGMDLTGAAMASDAFFPFPDCVEIAHQAGIMAVIQPGGSIKDELSIEYCNENGMAMVFTRTRHFKH